MEKLSKNDLTSIVINAMYVKLLLAIPRNMVIIAGNAAWLLSVYVTIVMLLLFFLITKIYDFSHPVMSIRSTPARIIIGVLISIFLLLSMTSVAKIYPETVKIILLKNTPLELIFIILGITVVLGARIGIEALGRISSLFQPVAGIIMAICFLLLIPHMHLSNLTPLFGNGFKTLFANGLSALSGFSDILLLFILQPDTKRPEEIKKTGYRSIIVMGIIMTVTLLVYSLIFPYNVSQNFVLPLYQMVRLIQIGDFFGRFEAFFEFVWSISVLLYFSIYLYALSIVWKKTFNLQYSKPLIAPFMIIVAVTVYSSPSYVQVNKNYMWYSAILIVSSLLLPTVAAFIKKSEERKLME